MDLIDIILAKALTPQAQVETYAALAQEAAANATSAIDTVEAAAGTISSLTDAAEYAYLEAQDLLAMATSAIDALTSATENMNDGIDNLSETLSFYMQLDNQSSNVSPQLIITYPNNQQTVVNTAVYYKRTGENTNGTMTQKAITDALASQATAINQSVDQKLANYTPSGGGSPATFDAPEGSILIVGPNGELIPSNLNEADLVETELLAGTYDTSSIVGIEIDYLNKTVTPTKIGVDFDTLTIFGGRRRCIVNDNGEIVAWDTDMNYNDNGSIGQAMIYQPKVYYLRIPIEVETVVGGTGIIKEKLLLSGKKLAGFKVHPLFIDENGHELDYVLLSAYEGSVYSVSNSAYNLTDAQNVDFNTDKLSSIAGAKPTSGTTQAFNVANATKLANNRGTGWTITNFPFESLLQMLMIVEYSTLNLQVGFAEGISSLEGFNNVNDACTTGSTSSLNSASGVALSTTQVRGGTSYTLTTAGKLAISYRGMENPYGNMWRLIGDTIITGNGNQYGGKITSGSIVANSCLQAGNTWITEFAYDAGMPWAFLPIGNKTNGTSAIPVGDYFWTTVALNGTHGLRIGSSGVSGSQVGPFAYGCDRDTDFHYYNTNARLMYIPTYNSTTYTNNIASWKAKTGSDLND